MNPIGGVVGLLYCSRRWHRRLVIGTALALLPTAAGAASLTALGDLPGGSVESRATGVSADGRTVVGTSKSTNGTEAFRWTTDSGMAGLGDLPGGSYFSQANAVSADGGTVVGITSSTKGIEAFRWTVTGGLTGLSNIPAGFTDGVANAVSGDGATVVGTINSGGGSESFRWNATEGLSGLGDLSGGAFSSEAYAISEDGSTVVGVGNSANGHEAFRWTTVDGFVGLGPLPGGGYFCVAYGVATDGGTVVGQCVNNSEAFRWTAAGGMTGLGDLSGGLSNSQANAVSADGRVVVGFGTTTNGNEAFVWTAADGMRSLLSVLVAQGFKPASEGWTKLSSAAAISADGRYVVGHGTRDGHTEAFLADMEGRSEPPPPYQQPPSLVSAQASLTPLGHLPGGKYHSEFAALSADGRTVVGWSESANGKEAFRWSLANGMTGLGDLAGGAFESSATAVSADGSVVAGNGTSADGREAFRWTSDGGMAGLGDLPGGAFDSFASHISADGGVVVGTSVGSKTPEPFRWTPAGGMTGLTGLKELISGSAGYGANVTGISDDGRTLVGEWPPYPFRWADSGQQIWLGGAIISGPGAPAKGVSADGSAWITDAIKYTGNRITPEGFRVATAGVTNIETMLGFLDGAISTTTTAISADGSTVVGFSSDNSIQAFRWTTSAGMIPLGYLTAKVGISAANSVSADGSTVAGVAYDSANNPRTFVWTPDAGMRSLEAVLLSKGIDPLSGGWTALTNAVVSRDGRYVAGTGTRDGNIEGFIADLRFMPPPSVTATVAEGKISLQWPTAAGSIYSVHRAARPEGPYTPIVTGLTTGSYTETPPDGSASFYRVSSP